MRAVRLAPASVASLWAALAAAACSAHAPAASTSPPTSPVNPPADRRASAHTVDAGDPCAGHDALWIDSVVPTPARWERGRLLGSGRAAVRLRWCGPGTALLRSITLTRADGVETRSSFAEEVPARGPLATGVTYPIEFFVDPDALEYQVTARARDARGGEHVAVAHFQTVENPERAAHYAACIAAGGRWGVHGMMALELCDRPTRDAGRRCTSDADCEGPCIETGAEPLGDSALPAGVTASPCGPGQNARIRVGRCHDRSLRFGCYPRVTRVVVECVRSGPSRGRLRGLSTVCVD